MLLSKNELPKGFSVLLADMFTLKRTVVVSTAIFSNFYTFFFGGGGHLILKKN